MTPTEQAEALVGFYKALTGGGVDEQAAGVLTIDLNKALIAGTVKLAEPTKAEKAAALASAAADKHAQRAAELEVMA